MKSSKIREPLPAYKDRSLKNRKGEKWEDIPGLDGYYLVSNFGRVKRVRRDLRYSTGRVCILREMIISPRIIKAPNKYMNDHTIQLFTHLAVEGRRYHISIRRAVYCCFIDPLFAMDDLNWIVVSKNGDGLDIHPDNLEVIRRSDRVQRAYERNRMEIVFHRASLRQKGTEASLATTSLQVSQYNKKGKRINTYPSMMEASRSTGLSHSAIRNAVHERDPSAGGFYWQIGNKKTFDVKTFLAKRSLSYKEKRGTKVTQYDIEGNPIKHYLTLRDAAKAMNGDPGCITAIFRGLTRTAYGYRWEKGFNNKKLKPLV